MANYRVKIKLNDFFPKIDAIPYDDFICLISCNNYFSRIKLTEYENQQFKFDLKIIKNTDLLFNIKLINYIDNNKLVGMYNLIIPHNKVNQILQREISLYKQQIKLIMNSNIKIKLFGIMMNITNIYLDLIFQISSIKGNAVLNNNQINKIRLYEMLGNNSYAKNYSKNKKKNKTSNNSIVDSKKNVININLSKSPNINYNNYIYDIKENEINKRKNYSNSNNNNFNNIRNQNYCDINFNVMNYNYLNYLKIDNNNNNNNNNNDNNDNNYVSNVKFNINSRSPIIISNKFVDLNNQENSNKKNIKQNKSTTYFNLINQNKIIDSSNKKGKIKEPNYINYQNISTKKKDKNKEAQLYIDPFMIQNNLNELNYDEMINNAKNNQSKYLTEAKNNKNYNNITNEHGQTETNQEKNDYKPKISLYQHLIKNNNKQNIAYINNNNKKQNILYDKKNHLNKFISNNKTSNKKTTNPNNNTKNKQEQEIVKTQVFRNKINFSEFDDNQNDNSKVKTPRNIKIVESKENNKTPILFSVSTNKKQEEEILELNDDLNLLDLNAKDKDEEKNNKNIKGENINKVEENKNVENKEKIEIKKIKDEIKIDPAEFKNKLIKSIEENQRLKKEIFSQILQNKEYSRKLLLIKEKFYTELKQRNRLNEKTNQENIKTFIHVNIQGKLNSNPYLSMKKIKAKEFNILYKIFYEHKNSPQYKVLEAKRKMKEKMEQQKKVHSLLNCVRELIKKYENLSQLYNDDEKKKILFKSLLVRYGIREKEENKENNLIDKFNEIKRKLEEEKKLNLMKVKKKEMQEDLYKNVIKEEEDEERSSISDHQYFRRKSSLRNRVSWGSEDSVGKDKDNFESNKSNNEDGNNSLLSSGLKRIRESVDENVVKDNENEIKKEKGNKDIISESNNKPNNKDNNI